MAFNIARIDSEALSSPNLYSSKLLALDSTSAVYPPCSRINLLISSDISATAAKLFSETCPRPTSSNRAFKTSEFLKRSTEAFACSRVACF